MRYSKKLQKILRGYYKIRFGYFHIQADEMATSAQRRIWYKISDVGKWVKKLWRNWLFVASVASVYVIKLRWWAILPTLIFFIVLMPYEFKKLKEKQSIEYLKNKNLKNLKDEKNTLIPANYAVSISEYRSTAHYY